VKSRAIAALSDKQLISQARYESTLGNNVILQILRPAEEYGPGRHAFL
jgi:hypothetical protein